MEGTLHAMPRGRDVVIEQIRIVGLRLRPAALVAAIVIGIITLLIARDIVLGSAETWFDADEWFQFSFIAFVVPFAVWRGDKRFGPAFLWTLPVDRRRLAFARVFAGWVWVMAALAGFIVWQLALAVIARVANPEIIPLVSLVGTTAAYLFGSALLLGLRHPLRWLLGTAGVFFLVGALNEAFEPFGVDAYLSSRPLSPLFADANLLPFLSLIAGLIAVWAAISRHRENR